MHTTQTAPADSTRNSLVDAIAAKVELAAETTDPAEKARLEGSIRRMTKDLDADDARSKPIRSATFRYVRNLARVARGDLRGTYSAARDLLDAALFGADRGRVERLIRACETHLARR